MINSSTFRSVSTLFFCFTILMGFGQKPKPKNDLEAKFYKGKVQTVFEIDKDGIDNKDYFFKTESRYDVKGNLSEMIRYTSGDVVVYKVRYFYNYKNSLTQEKKYKVKKDGSMVLEYNHNYMYNASDKLIEETSYTVDENGKEALYEKFNYTLDAAGNVVQLIILDGDLKQIKRIVIEYDAVGNRISLKTFNSDNLVMHSEKSKYDERGNQIEYVEFDETGRQVGKNVRMFDANNHEIRWSSLGLNDTLLARNDLVYNAQGLLIQINSFSDPNNPELRKSFSYTMDSQGNWTRKLFYKNGKLTEVKERIISYYE